MKIKHEAARYYDQDTQRYRWAVFSTPSNTWTFPKRYGKAPARKLAERLNKEAS